MSLKEIALGLFEGVLFFLFAGGLIAFLITLAAAGGKL